MQAAFPAREPLGERARVALCGDRDELALESVAAVLAAVDDGRAHAGVVPLEDSVAGLRADTVDALVFDSEHLLVTGEVDLDDDGVTTRWVSVGREPVVTPADPQTLLFVVPALNRPGTLLEVLAAFSSRGLNLTRVGTRPLHGALGMYGFLLEVEGSPLDAWVADALADLLAAASHVKFLGTFGAGERTWSAVTGQRPAGDDLQTVEDLDALVDRLRATDPGQARP